MLMHTHTYLYLYIILVKLQIVRYIDKKSNSHVLKYYIYLSIYLSIYLYIYIYIYICTLINMSVEGKDVYYLCIDMSHYIWGNWNE